MADPIQIRRYPNRRFYSRDESRYVSLEDIEQLVRDGRRLEIRDSQTDEDLTRVVLVRVLLEKSPEKMALFPVELLHFMLRANDVMADFLRDYFRHSLTYLDYLQRHSAAVPMHWVQAWLDSLGRPLARAAGRDPLPAAVAPRPDEKAAEFPLPVDDGADDPPDDAEQAVNERLRLQIQQLEQRIHRLERSEDRDRRADL